MIEGSFYCERPTCSVHNRKTQGLANYLESLKNTEFVFDKTFTPVMLFEVLGIEVAILNETYGGREIKVHMMRFDNTILYTFKDTPHSDTSLGCLSLKPIKRIIHSLEGFD